MEADAATQFVLSHPRYIAAAAKSARASERRAALPAGSSRARVTTANAKWMIAAEARDLVEAELRAEFAKRSVAAPKKVAKPRKSGAQRHLDRVAAMIAQSKAVAS